MGSTNSNNTENRQFGFGGSKQFAQPREFAPPEDTPVDADEPAADAFGDVDLGSGTLTPGVKVPEHKRWDQALLEAKVLKIVLERLASRIRRS